MGDASERTASRPRARRLLGMTAAVVCVGGAGFVGGAMTRSGPTSLTPVAGALGSAPEYCGAVSAAYTSIAQRDVVDEAVVSDVERLAAALPDSLSVQGARLSQTYRALAVGDLMVLADEAAVAETDLASSAIVEHLRTVCGIEING
ncbi:MAG: hypothetical protein R2715_07305 [Ilumatobacteraceae bacterium]